MPADAELYFETKLLLSPTFPAFPSILLSLPKDFRGQHSLSVRIIPHLCMISFYLDTSVCSVGFVFLVVVFLASI